MYLCKNKQFNPCKSLNNIHFQTMMEYNTSREKLQIPEYGRNIQKMIDYAISIEDRDKRNKAAHTIVAVMAQLTNMHRSDSPDVKQKMWDHLFIISEFRLDVDSPFPKPDPDIPEHKVEKCAYPNTRLAFRQYGKIVERMIQKTIECEDAEEKEVLVRLIANHLKKLYMSWNRDSVADEVIATHLSELSGGKLKLGENVKLDVVKELIPVSNISSSNKKKKRMNNGKTGFQSNKNWKRKPY